MTDGQNTTPSLNIYFLEADEITGPWRLVTYLRDFGEQAYFVTIASKFIDSGGHKLWLGYSANFTNDGGRTHYQSDLHVSVRPSCISQTFMYQSDLHGSG